MKVYPPATSHFLHHLPWDGEGGERRGRWQIHYCRYHTMSRAQELNSFLDVIENMNGNWMEPTFKDTEHSLVLKFEVKSIFWPSEHTVRLRIGFWIKSLYPVSGWVGVENNNHLIVEITDPDHYQNLINPSQAWGWSLWQISWKFVRGCFRHHADIQIKWQRWNCSFLERWKFAHKFKPQNECCFVKTISWEDPASFKKTWLITSNCSIPGWILRFCNLAPLPVFNLRKAIV